VKELLAPLVAFFLAPSLLQASHLPIKTPTTADGLAGITASTPTAPALPDSSLPAGPAARPGEHPAKAKAGGNYPKVK